MKAISITAAAFLGFTCSIAAADTFVYKQVREQTQDGQRFEFYVDELSPADGPMYFLLRGAGDLGGPRETLSWTLDSAFVGVEVGSFSSGAKGGPFLYLNLDGVWEFARYYQFTQEQTTEILKNGSFNLVISLEQEVNDTPVSFIGVELGYEIAPVPELPTNVAIAVGLLALGTVARRNTKPTSK